MWLTTTGLAIHTTHTPKPERLHTPLCLQCPRLARDPWPWPNRMITACPLAAMAFHRLQQVLPHRCWAEPKRQTRFCTRLHAKTCPDHAQVVPPRHTTRVHRRQEFHIDHTNLSLPRKRRTDPWPVEPRGLQLGFWITRLHLAYIALFTAMRKQPSVSRITWTPQLNLRDPCPLCRLPPPAWRLSTLMSAKTHRWLLCRNIILAPPLSP